jgi:hypothetical protein
MGTQLGLFCLRVSKLEILIYYRNKATKKSMPYKETKGQQQTYLEGFLILHGIKGETTISFYF